jgi:AcrR family transcriptional regulator
MGAIAEGGVAHVSIERLARELGATKGSFYWHFKDRPAVIAAALAQWEHDETDAVIERLAAIADPRRRLRSLLTSALEPRPGALIEGNLLAGGGDPAIAEVLARVAAKRLACAERTFRQATASAPADRALLALSAHAGMTQLRRTSPAFTLTSRRTRTYLDHIVAWLLAPDAP